MNIYCLGYGKVKVIPTILYLEILQVLGVLI